MSKTPSGSKVSSAISPAQRWARLRQELRERDASLVQKLRQGDRSPERQDWERSLLLVQRTLQVYSEILRLMKDIEEDNLDPNAKSDVLNAREIPYSEEVRY